MFFIIRFECVNEKIENDLFPVKFSLSKLVECPSKTQSESIELDLASLADGKLDFSLNKRCSQLVPNARIHAMMLNAQLK